MNTRFGLSEQEFKEVFDSLDDCVLAALEDGLQRVSRTVVNAAGCEDGWPDRVRAALSALLAFFDEEPHWACFLIAEPFVAAAAVLERRRQAGRSLVSALTQEMHTDARASGWLLPSSELTAELIVGGAFSVIRARMLDDAPTNFAELEQPLMKFILALYRSADGRLIATDTDARGPRPKRGPVRATYRTTRVLSAIGGTPGLSNREIADAAGLSDEGQTSKLLHRLERRGLLQNCGLGQSQGGSNSWLLTDYGQEVLDATRHSLVPGAGAIVGRRARGAS